MTTGDTEYLTVSETARALRVEPKTVYRWIAAGQLEAVRLGTRTIRVPAKSVSEMLTAGYTSTKL